MILDVAAIETATVDALRPRRRALMGDWLLAMDPGVTRRAASAAPLRHDADIGPVRTAIEGAFVDAGIPPTFRIADVAGLAGVRAILTEAGYSPEQPTLLEAGPTETMADLADPAELFEAPCEGWVDVFSGPGFDVHEETDRARALMRCPTSMYAAVRIEGRPAAVGVVAFGHGWCSVHGMRTAQAHRGRGLAARVLAAMGQEAMRRGLDRAFLQVEEGNASALALYRRAGFRTGWLHHYWNR